MSAEAVSGHVKSLEAGNSLRWVLMAGYLNSEKATTLYPAFLRPSESPPAPLNRLIAFLATTGRFLEATAVTFWIEALFTLIISKKLMWSIFTKKYSYLDYTYKWITVSYISRFL